jgi:hypothetical protein
VSCALELAVELAQERSSHLCSQVVVPHPAGLQGHHTNKGTLFLALLHSLAESLATKAQTYMLGGLTGARGAGESRQQSYTPPSSGCVRLEGAGRQRRTSTCLVASQAPRAQGNHTNTATHALVQVLHWRPSSCSIMCLSMQM